mmetsp:Transcript_37447/g.84876  ORF Transcript_37447/g.84876 Transcript_37447/m.84876 type:complete len:455 (-) Transcript_37447:300-1664(-)
MRRFSALASASLSLAFDTSFRRAESTRSASTPTDSASAICFSRDSMSSEIPSSLHCSRCATFIRRPWRSRASRSLFFAALMNGVATRHLPPASMDFLSSWTLMSAAFGVDCKMSSCVARATPSFPLAAFTMCGATTSPSYLSLRALSRASASSEHMVFSGTGSMTAASFWVASASAMRPSAAWMNFGSIPIFSPTASSSRTGSSLISKGSTSTIFWICSIRWSRASFSDVSRVSFLRASSMKSSFTLLETAWLIASCISWCDEREKVVSLTDHLESPNLTATGTARTGWYTQSNRNVATAVSTSLYRFTARSRAACSTFTFFAASVTACKVAKSILRGSSIFLVPSTVACSCCAAMACSRLSAPAFSFFSLTFAFPASFSASSSACGSTASSCCTRSASRTSRASSRRFCNFLASSIFFFWFFHADLATLSFSDAFIEAASSSVSMSIGSGSAR